MGNTVKIDYNIKDQYTVTQTNAVGSENRGNVAESPTNEFIVNGTIDLTPDHHYKLQETSGTTVTDDGTGAQNGTSNGATVNQTGLIDKSYLFDGTNDYITVNNISTLQLTQVFSIALWFKRSADSGVAEWLLSKTQLTGSTLDNYRVGITGADTLQIAFHDTGGTLYRLESNTTISTNKWYHAVLIFNQTEFYIYLNGKLNKKGYNGASGNPSGITPDTSTDPLEIGRRYNGATYDYNFNGYMEDIRIYNRVLTEWEINLLYNNYYGSHSQSFTYTPTIRQGIEKIDLPYGNGTPTTHLTLTTNKTFNDTSIYLNDNKVIQAENGNTVIIEKTNANAYNPEQYINDDDAVKSFGAGLFNSGGVIVTDEDLQKGGVYFVKNDPYNLSAEITYWNGTSWQKFILPESIRTMEENLILGFNRNIYRFEPSNETLTNIITPATVSNNNYMKRVSTSGKIETNNGQFIIQKSANTFSHYNGTPALVGDFTFNNGYSYFDVLQVSNFFLSIYYKNASGTEYGRLKVLNTGIGNAGDLDVTSDESADPNIDYDVSIGDSAGVLFAFYNESTALWVLYTGYKSIRKITLNSSFAVTNVSDPELTLTYEPKYFYFTTGGDNEIYYITSIPEQSLIRIYKRDSDGNWDLIDTIKERGFLYAGFNTVTETVFKSTAYPDGYNGLLENHLLFVINPQDRTIDIPVPNHWWLMYYTDNYDIETDIGTTGGDFTISPSIAIRRRFAKIIGASLSDGIENLGVVRFNGTSTTALSSTSIFNPTLYFTISFYAFIENNASAGTMLATDSYHNYGGNKSDLGIRVDSQNRIEIFCDDGTTTKTAVTTKQSYYNEWVHIVLQHGLSGYSLFVNGEPIGTMSTSYSFSTTLLRLGGQYVGTPTLNEYFTGSIQDMRYYYPDILSTDIIKELYRQGLHKIYIYSNQQIEMNANSKLIGLDIRDSSNVGRDELSIIKQNYPTSSIQYCTIDGNNTHNGINGGNGIANNSIIKNVNTGVYLDLKDYGKVSLTNNLILANEYGINFGKTISNVDITNITSNSTINHNTIEANNGIRLPNIPDQAIKNNIIDGSNSGINIVNISNKTVINNLINGGLTNVTDDGTNELNINPLFKDEYNDDYNLMSIAGGYPKDSIAIGLANDGTPNKDSGCYDMTYTNNGETLKESIEYEKQVDILQTINYINSDNTFDYAGNYTKLNPARRKQFIIQQALEEKYELVSKIYEVSKLEEAVRLYPFGTEGFTSVYDTVGGVQTYYKTFEADFDDVNLTLELQGTQKFIRDLSGWWVSMSDSSAPSTFYYFRIDSNDDTFLYLKNYEETSIPTGAIFDTCIVQFVYVKLENIQEVVTTLLTMVGQNTNISKKTPIINAFEVENKDE